MDDATIPASDLEALLRGAALHDRSERGKLALTGSEAKAFLQGQVTQDVDALEPGQGGYALFLTNKGKILGDLRVLDTGEELLLDCERSALQALFNLIHRTKLGRDVELHKRTLERGLLSLLGPRARTVSGADAAGLSATEGAHVAASIGGVPVRLIATDADGVDVLCPADGTPGVADALVAAGAVRVGEAAVEAQRVVRGRPRLGFELDEGVIPQEAGLNERAVSFTKGCYVGQETVARLHYRGRPNRHLRGLRLAGSAVESGDELRVGEKVVGRVGTVASWPGLGPLALALVRREVEPGAEVAVGAGGSARVLALPFEE